MTKPLPPIHFFSNLTASDLEAAGTTLRGLGFAPYLVPLTRLPSSVQVRAWPAVAIVVDTRFSVEAQRKRAKDLASRSSIPFIQGSLEGGLSEESPLVPQLQKILDRIPANRVALLDLLESEGKSHCWGWHLGWLSLMPGAIPESIESRKAFQDYLARLGPEDLPERLRPKKQGVDAPAPKPAPPPPVTLSPVEVLNSKLVALQEEYDTLKAEYDATVNRLTVAGEVKRELEEQLGTVNAEARFAQEQIRDLAEEIQRMQGWIDPATLPTLSQQWKEEGAKHERQRLAQVREGLDEQIRDLQNNLAEADKEVAKLQSELDAARTEVAKARKAPPPNLKPAPTQPASNLKTVLNAFRTLIQEGALTPEAALEKLYAKFG